MRGTRQRRRRVEEEAVFARLVAQGAVGALEETVTRGGVLINLIEARREKGNTINAVISDPL